MADTTSNADESSSGSLTDVGLLIRVACLVTASCAMMLVSHRWYSGFWNFPQAVGYSSVLVFLIFVGAKWKREKSRVVSLSHVMVGVACLALWFAGMRYGDSVKEHRRQVAGKLETKLERYVGTGSVSVGSLGDVTLIVESDSFGNQQLVEVLAAVDGVEFATIRFLAIYSPQVNDGTIEQLGDRPHLKSLILPGALLSAELRANLAGRYPNCDVDLNAVVGNGR